jgi:Protein ENHANCED DISEASE RESISTANCE 2, C-terminal
VHSFGTLARKGMEVMFNNFSKMVIDVGFCIEGRLDEELPEVFTQLNPKSDTT